MLCWQIWHTVCLSEHSDLFTSLLLPADESQEHDFAVHIIKFLSLQARRSSNSSVVIWSSSALAIPSSFLSHAQFLRLGLMMFLVHGNVDYVVLLQRVIPKEHCWVICSILVTLFYYNLLLLLHIVFIWIPIISTFSNEFLQSTVSIDLFELQ